MIRDARKSALLVFAKTPVPGRVKTRLTPPLTPEEAGALYAAFLDDAFAQYAELEVDVLAFLATKEATAVAEAAVRWPGSFGRARAVFAQQGSGLGERMAHAVARSFRAGYERLVVIGTDHPTLPLDFVRRAFRELEAGTKIVIGPSEDGGYYLLGMNQFFPELWDGMRYSHTAVFEQTLNRAERTSASLVVLPVWYDVDDATDLDRLIRDLAALKGSCPATRRVLRGMRPDAPFDSGPGS